MRISRKETVTSRNSGANEGSGKDLAVPCLYIKNHLTNLGQFPQGGIPKIIGSREQRLKWLH